MPTADSCTAAKQQATCGKLAIALKAERVDLNRSVQLTHNLSTVLERRMLTFVQPLAGKE